jgi:hypothetical protein
MSDAVAAFDARAAFFRENLNTAALGTQTREALSAAESKGVVLVLPDGDPTLAFDGMILGAPSDIATEDRVLGPVGLHYDGVIVVFGLGFGHVVRALIDRTRAPIVVFEPDVGLLRTVFEFGPWDLPTVHIVSTTAELERLWSQVTGNRPHAKLIASPGYNKLYPAELERTCASIRTLVADVELVENTRSMRYREWISHILQNVHVVTEHPLAMGIGDALRGKPAFVIGAGPSLDKNIAMLREAGQKGVVICVEVAGRAIAKFDQGPPHFVVSLEGQNLSAELEVATAGGQSIRAISLCAHPGSLTAGTGELMPFFEVLPAFRGLTELTGFHGLTVGGSVSTVAFSLALQLGCSPIVLVGQDLAFSDGKTHAGGTVFEATRIETSKESGLIHFKNTDVQKKMRENSHLGQGAASDVLFEAEAWGGEGTVPTNSTWNSYRLWFEVGAETIHQAAIGTRLVNCTEGGARIHGFEELTLRQLLDTLPDSPVTAAELVTIAKARGLVTRPALRKWAADNARVCHRIKRSAFLLEKSAEQASSSMAKNEPFAIKRAFERLDRAEREMRLAARRQPMLDAWSYGLLSDLTITPQALVEARERDAKHDAEWGVRTEGELAKVLRRSATDLEELFRGLEARLEG